MLRPGTAVILCALMLLTIGVVMVNSAGMSVTPLSASAVVADASGVTFWTILTSQASMYAVLAIGAMLVFSRLPIAKLAGRFETPSDRVAFHPADGMGVFLIGLGLVVAVMVLVYVPGLGKTVNGATRWIVVPGIGVTVQPSEIAKWAVPVLLAWYAVRRAPMLGSFTLGLVPALGAIGLVSALVVLEDLGTGVLIAAAGCIVLLAAGCRLTHLLWFAPPAILGLVAAILTNPYRIQRIWTFIHPFEDPQGSGYHMLQSLATIAGGEGSGRGLGHGLQKFGYLPEDTTDFLYAVICEEMGIVGALVVVSLYCGLLISLWTIAREQRAMPAKLFVLGVLSTIGLQAVMNLFVVTGLGPTKGIALPLLSAGGSGWVLTGVCLGLASALQPSERAEDDEIELGDSYVEAKPRVIVHLDESEESATQPVAA